MLNGIIRLRCLDEHQLAAYVDQQLIGAERERVESHLAKCDPCLQQVAFLTRQAQVALRPGPEWLLRRAERFETVAQGNAPRAWEWATVAVAIVVAIGVVVWREARPHLNEPSAIVATTQRPQVPDVPGKPNPKAETTVRSASPHVSLPVVLSPQPGATVHISDFTIRWAPVPNAAAYEVRVVTADGDVVWHKRVHENSVRPPNQTLRPGVKYFVWVRALSPDGKTQQSAAVGFIGG